MSHRRTLLKASLAATMGLTLNHPTSWAQTAPVKVIIPFPAGGGGDSLARLMLSPAIANYSGTPNAIFENIGGAGGNLGAIAALKTDKNSDTFFYGTNGTHAINQTLYSKPGFSALNDFEPVSRLSSIALLVVIRPGLAVNSLSDLLKMLKSNPGKFTYGSAGNGTTSHLAMESLKAQAGLHVVHVPYRGGAQAITDLIGGQVDMMIEISANAAPQVKAGRIRALGVSTITRLPGFEDLPTIAESGVPGFDVSAWDAVFIPKAQGAPNLASVEKMNRAIRAALGDAKLKEQLAARGAVPTPSSPEELKKFVTTEIERWAIAIKRSGAKID
jgi:tripartite-type tricarboxylate transporter receptor subunit TctC